MTATPCRLPTCRRTTTDSSGYCHDHRWPAPNDPHRVTPPTPLPYASRTDEATVIRHDPDTGALLSERWLDENRQNHRDGAPSCFEYYPDGTVKREWWHHHGSQHRVGGPAETEYLPDGRTFAEYYRLDGRYHRIGGPASVNYGLTGEVRKKSYSLHGVVFTNGEEIARHLLTTSDEGIAAELEESEYAPLIAEGREPRRIVEVLAEGVTTLDGIREVLDGAPAEWVRAYEGSKT